MIARLACVAVILLGSTTSLPADEFSGGWGDSSGSLFGSIYQPFRDAAGFLDAGSASQSTVFRGQSPFYDSTGTYWGSDATTFYPPTYAPNGGFAAPGTSPGYSGTISNDPWLSGVAPNPYVMQSPNPYGMGTFGLNGPQPYRLGWTHSYEVEFLPKVGTSSQNVGNFGVFGVDLEMKNTQVLGYDWIFSAAPQFNYRAWDGPRGTNAAMAVSHLPGSAYRFGLDMRLATPFYYGWSVEGGFNPAVATDFNQSLSSDAWLFDAHGVLFWRVSPQWMWAIGAAYWDRVDDIVIPYAGAVWTPNDYWEFRLLFPESRVSVFLGTPYGIATWLYLSGEYHVEAYQIALEPTPAGTVKTRVQLEDWRVMGGLKWEAGWMTTFIEAGWVFGRSVEFDRVGTSFDPSTGFIGRIGIRY